MLNNETLFLFLLLEDYSVRVLTDLQQTSATDTKEISFLHWLCSGKNLICMHQYKNFVKLGSARVHFSS